MSEPKGVNYGKEVLLKDIQNDTLFVNKTLGHFMVKEINNGNLFIQDIQNKKYYPSTEHSDTDECIVCTEDYRQFAYNCEVERIKLLRAKDTPDEEFYTKHGLKAIPVPGTCWFTTKATVYKVLEGVHYIIDCTDACGEYVDQAVQEVIECYNIITSNYHQQIKEVVKYLEQNSELGPIWVLISGHTVYHQVFIGNNTGYLCSMWYGKYHPVPEVNCKVEWYYNNKYFKEFKTDLNVKVTNATE